MDGQRILKILVIEERPEYQDIFRAGLSGMGQVRLLFAPSLKVGIVALKKTPFDLLLLRGEISAANNHALIRAIRADAKYDKLAVIVVYPRCGTDEARAALNAGATSCLTAQFDPQAVRAAVLEALRAEGQVQPRLVRAAGTAERDAGSARPQGSKESPGAAAPAPDAARSNADPRKPAGSAQGSDVRPAGPHGPSGPATPPASPTTAGTPDPIDDDEDARRLVRSGEDLLARRLFTKAAQVFLAVLKRKPLSADAFSGLAESFSGLGDAVQTFTFRHKAVSALAVEGRMAEAGKAARRMGEAPAGMSAPLEDPFLIAGRQLQESGQLDRAVSAYETGLERSAGTGELRKELAVAYLRQGKEKKAVRTLTDGGLDASLLEPARKAMRAQSGHSSAGAAQQGGGGGTARHTSGVQQEASAADWKEKRQYPRIPLVDFSVSLGRQDEVYIVVDISMGGICFKMEPGMLEPGQVFRFNLLDSQDVRLKKVQAVVRFVGADRVGCQFLELSDTQKAALEELISQEQNKAAESDDVVLEDVAGIRRDPSGKIIIEVDW
ncbi:PilZ domain-containing protein [Desulfovibrio psychrotolerans]|uniref:Response regulatory domain-containing protein n=1 Tax=Desulfovibrio psychrotolerans TaxID=415242 RepID=A0A7J0BTW5_9BACT|nr:PilZ domain-containing protein [Desulfovibrio psychrotolerans]GFM37108.1 hypothetical protein DSM19430T_17920 [Desulfovibrio psychrotolerans]